MEILLHMKMNLHMSTWPHMHHYCCLARVFGFGFHLIPTYPGWGLWCVCLVTVLGLCPAIPGWGLWCVFSGTIFVFSRPIVAGVWDACFNPGWGVGWLCLCAGATCTVSPGQSFGCTCLGAVFGFTPPILAGVCGVRVRVWILTSPCQSWMGCGLCVCVRVSTSPCQSWLGFAVCVSFLHCASPQSPRC